MRHKVRSIIIRVDSRMDVMSECIPNNTISRMNMEKLDNMINNSIEQNAILILTLLSDGNNSLSK